MARPASALSQDQLDALYETQDIDTSDLIKQYEKAVQEAPKPQVKQESFYNFSYKPLSTLKNMPGPAAAGVVQGATLGYADEAEGAARAVGKSIGGSKESLGDLYRSERDTVRSRYEALRAQSPVTYEAGAFAGGVLPMLTPLGQVAAAGPGVAIRWAAARGAATGAALAPGFSNADLTKGDVKGLSEDMAFGATLGGILSGGFRAIGSLNGSSAEKVAAERAVKATTGQSKKAYLRITKSTTNAPQSYEKGAALINKTGLDLLKETHPMQNPKTGKIEEVPVLGFFDKVEDLAPKLEAANSKYGNLIGKVSKEIDDIVPNAVDAKSIADKIRKFSDRYPDMIDTRAIKDGLEKRAQEYEKLGSIGMRKAQDMKNQYKYKATDADAVLSNQDATNALNMIVGGEMEATADVMASLVSSTPELNHLGPLLKDFAKFKSKFGSFADTSAASADRAKSNISIRWASPSDMATGLTAFVAAASKGGSALASLGIAAAVGATNNVLRTRGSAMAARSAYAYANLFKSKGFQAFKEEIAPILKLARKGNPQAVATMRLLDEAHPEIIKQLADKAKE